MKKLLLLVLIPFVMFAQSAGGNFSVGPNMTEARMGHHHFTLSNGDIILLGGHTTDFVSSSGGEYYYYQNNMFSHITMNYPHDGGAVVQHSNGYYYVFGGAANLGIAPGYNTCELYAPYGTALSALNNGMNYGRMMASGAELMTMLVQLMEKFTTLMQVLLQ